MRRILLIAIIGMLTTCKADMVSPEKVIYGLKVSNDNLFADGTTIIDVWVNIDPAADADKRTVIFSAKSGVFLPSKDTMVTQKAVFENGQLVARVKYTIPSVAGVVILRARPEIQNKVKNFFITDTLDLKPSVPATLKLLPSALGLKSGFNNEISLIATLKNIDGGNVSNGNKVLFEDYYPGGAPVGGKFRTLRETTDASSTASATYSPGALPVGTTFYIRATQVDNAGVKLLPTDFSLITITN